jgi:UDP:flavonoid glycosyltransferase YjiC (YdhE family)
MDRPLAPAVNRFRERLGLPPVRRGFREWRLSARRVVGLWPAWFAGLRPDWPRQVRLSGFPLWDGAGVTAVPPEVEEFLSSGPSPVLFLPGTAMLQSRAFFASSLEACRRLSLRALLLGGDAGSLPRPLPPFALHAPYAPLSLLLPRAAAVVHHAGIGTSAQALRAGTPQLLKPVAYDQFDNAERVSRLGCGIVLPDRRYDAGPAEAALRRLFGSPLRCAEAAARLRGEDGLLAACDLALDALRSSGAEGV